MSRVEQDSLGQVQIPESATYGKNTARVLSTYPMSESSIPRLFIEVYILLKKSYAAVNAKNSKLDKEKAHQISSVCDQLIQLDKKSFKSYFPIGRIQSGGGTSTNMMVNEVIANICESESGGNPGEYVKFHPNNDINMSQSSNDTFPSVIQIVSLIKLLALLEAAQALRKAIKQKIVQYGEIEKVGRTHLQDALRIRLGEEFSAYARTIEKNIEYLKHFEELLLELPVGGTAVGTPQNITPTIREEIIKQLSKEFGYKFTQSKNYFETNSSSGMLSKLSSALADFARDLIKICNDIRLLSSGPDAGIGEIRLPTVQAGSSIMPGKVNPSVVEAFEMMLFELIGDSTTVNLATLHAQLQLQQFSPVIAWKLYDSLHWLTHGIHMFKENCIDGLTPNIPKAKENLEKSNVYATEYSEKLGYEKVAELVKSARENGQDLKKLLDRALKEL